VRGAEDVLALRRRYWQNGYRPIEVWNPDQTHDDEGKKLNNPGKQPRGQWRKAAEREPPDAARHNPDSRALSTGVPCGENKIVAFDIDVPRQDVVNAIVHLIEQRLGTTPLVRIGREPKTLLVYRTETPFPKIETPELFWPDGTKAQVEVLGDGQQFVADGIHPNTGQPYRWTDGCPATVPLKLLPPVAQAAAREVVVAAEETLRLAGATNPPREEPPGGRPNGQARREGGFFSNVNSAALADIAAWVIEIFPTAEHQANTGAWRVPSADLGRDLEEDISVHPGGIRDFGMREGLTPIDLVVRHGGKDTALDAALWLCERLSVEPEGLGFTTAMALEDFYAYMPTHQYIYVPTRAIWPAASVNSRIPPVSLPDAKEIAPSQWLDRKRPVEQMSWAPGMPEVIRDRLLLQGGWVDHPGRACFNHYHPPTIVHGDKDGAKPWLDHVGLIYPDDAEHIINWLAHRVQRPGEKINHALLLGGNQGIGKDTLLEPVKRAVGPWNFQEASPRQVLGRFNGFLKSVVLRISEVRDLGEFDRYQFYDAMKAYVAAPPDVLRVDEKFLPEYPIVNVCGVVITTNHKADGIYLPNDDRRHYVAWSDRDKEEFAGDYWGTIWGFYNDGGFGHIAAYLAQRDLGNFDAKAPPPKTDAFWEIVNANNAPEEPELADLIDELGKRVEGVIERPKAVTLRELQNGAQGSFYEWINDRKNRRIIPHRLEKVGYVPVRNPDAKDGLWKIDGARQVVYAQEKLTKGEQRKEAEALTKVTPVSVVSVVSDPLSPPYYTTLPY
jgi:hypothetical protein